MPGNIMFCFYKQNITKEYLLVEIRNIKFYALSILNEIYYVSYNQNNSYEIAMNGYQARKINVIRNVIFGFQLWETLLSIKAKVGIFTMFST